MSCWLVQEAKLPVNLDPSNSKLENAEDRHRIARVFDHGLTRATGHVLPVQRWQSRAGQGWYSEKWRLRREKLFLIPGDSPVGYRLPIASLPWMLKPLFGLISDRLPLFGSRRRSYLMISGAALGLSMFALAAGEAHPEQRAWLLGLVTIASAAGHARSAGTPHVATIAAHRRVAARISTRTA